MEQVAPFLSELMFSLNKNDSGELVIKGAHAKRSSYIQLDDGSRIGHTQSMAEPLSCVDVAELELCLGDTLAAALLELEQAKAAKAALQQQVGTLESELEQANAARGALEQQLALTKAELRAALV